MKPREIAIEILANLVYQSNVENWKMRIQEGENSPSDKFSEYGTDTETVGMIVKDLISEVADKVEEIQSK